jgi:hypothetical protein
MPDFNPALAHNPTAAALSLHAQSAMPSTEWRCNATQAWPSEIEGACADVVRRGLRSQFNLGVAASSLLMRLFRAVAPESDTTVQLAEAIRQVANSAESEMDLQVKVSKLHGSQPKLDEDGRTKCERLREGSHAEDARSKISRVLPSYA